MKPAAIGINWRTPAEVFADRLWQAHGEALRDLPVAALEERVRELASLVGATQAEEEAVLAHVGQHLRDEARPMDTRPARRRLFQTEESEDAG